MSGTHVPEGPKILVLTLLYNDNSFPGADIFAIPFRTVRSHLGIDVFVFSRGPYSQLAVGCLCRLQADKYNVYFSPKSSMSSDFASSGSRDDVPMKRMFTNLVRKKLPISRGVARQRLSHHCDNPHPVRQRPKLRWQLCLFASLRRAPTSVCSVFVVMLSSFGSGVYVLTQGC